MHYQNVRDPLFHVSCTTVTSFCICVIARFHTGSNQLPSIGEPAKQVEIEDKTGRRSPTRSRDIRVGHGGHRSSKRQRNRYIDYN